MPPLRTAAIVTVGSELVEGLRIDTNTAEIARALAPRGFRVDEAVSVGDDSRILEATLRRLLAQHDLVITTGGLGPTHDDITREAAAATLGLPLVRSEALAEGLAPVVRRHLDASAAEQVLAQALVLEGAEVLPATTGTAPGQVIEVGAARLALLPGPPAEMRPMLAAVAQRYPLVLALPREVGVVGLTESDAQVRAQAALEAFPAITLTVLAKPGDVRVLLLDAGAGEHQLDAATAAVATALGDACYSVNGETLAEVVVSLAREQKATLGFAESCTGGLVAAAITDVPGASDVFLGSVVSYSNEAKERLLGVRGDSLDRFGAVSEQTAQEMAEGARRALGVDLAVSITGIAGPGGGSADKPVGLVWFGTASATGITTVRTDAPAGASREAIRARATATALNQARRRLLERSGDTG